MDRAAADGKRMDKLSKTCDHIHMELDRLNNNHFVNVYLDDEKVRTRVQASSDNGTVLSKRAPLSHTAASTSRASWRLASGL